jgi:pimeloyl-ACP methyl ester carboxylesterase
MIDNHDFAGGDQLNIVGHSHGGNIGILVIQMTNRKIDNLVTLGTPMRSDYQPNSETIAKCLKNLKVPGAHPPGNNTLGAGFFYFKGRVPRIIPSSGSSVLITTIWSALACRGCSLTAASRASSFVFASTNVSTWCRSGGATSS